MTLPTAVSTATSCDFDPRVLSAWFDGEAGVRGHVVEAHLRDCKVCPQKLQQMRRVQASMAGALDKAMGPLEPLYALQRIRERTAHRATRSWMQRLLGGLHDAWLFHRPALAAVSVMAFLFVAGIVTWSMADMGTTTMSRAVAIESLHVEANAKTHVSASPDGRATLIWVEAQSGNTDAPH